VDVCVAGGQLYGGGWCVGPWGASASEDQIQLYSPRQFSEDTVSGPHHVCRSAVDVVSTE